MRNEHDRFESLAGAVMLGEATADERDVFEAHAKSCERCRDDAGATPIAETLLRASDSETWRPSLRSSVVARIHASQTSRFRVSVGLFGWTLALSVIVNAAIATGLTTRIASAFTAATAAVSISLVPERNVRQRARECALGGGSGGLAAPMLTKASPPRC